jgi:site-specific DNA-methyltransferase (adenine-specific)
MVRKMKNYKVTLKDKEVVIVQDDDGKFIKPDFLIKLESYGTALKPAFEPIIVAMKPTTGTFVDNALNWDVAGLNIDGNRVRYEEGGSNSSNPLLRKQRGLSLNHGVDKKPSAFTLKKEKGEMNINSKGRWPANVILDEEAGRLLDEQSGISKSTGGKGTKSGLIDNPSIYGKFSGEDVGSNAGGLGDSGGASRFFYCAKASKAERNAGCERLEEKEDTEMTGRKKGSAGLLRVRADGSIGENPYAGKSAKAANYHPTVKPLKLIEYLCRLTKTPMGGIVLDPYVGSGTTAVACINTGRRFIGIENVKEYYAIAVSRVKHAYAARRKKS